MTAAVDITWMRSGKIVAIEPTAIRKRKRIMWRCVCDCGGEILCHSNSIKNHDNTSCGCGTAPKLNDHLRAFIERNEGNTDCWEWQGFCDKDGYGRAKFNGVTTVAHRAVYLMVKGEIPDGLNLLHSCDNPPCCNPDHVFPGTQKDNCLDAKAKDRHSRGMRNGLSKFTDDQIRYIRGSSKTQWELADEFGVWQGTISTIKRRTRWMHVAD